MNHVSLFSGIGGIDLAAHWAGMTTVAFCERDPYCQRVLAKHWPNVPIIDDIHHVTKQSLSTLGVDRIDIISGGFPCQPYSFAGKRLGNEDDRALWPQMLRVIGECRPRWVVGENVAGIIGMALDGVLASLEAEGYEARAVVLPACAVGAWHIRQRVFIVANADIANGEAWIRNGMGERTPPQPFARYGVGEDVPNADGVGRLKGRAESARREGRSEVVIGGSSFADANGQQHEGQPHARRRTAAAELCALQHASGAGREEFNTSRVAGDAGHSAWRSDPRGSQWAVEPAVGRVAHGIPRRVDRLRALSNAVVPQQAYPILAEIVRLESM